MNKSHGIVCRLSLAVLLFFLPHTLQAQAIIDWKEIDSRRLFEPRIFDLSIFEGLGVIDIWPLTPAQAKGDPNCRRGEPDCNRCTADVAGQFRKIASGQKQRKEKPWRFKWGREYEPEAIKPFDAFDEDSPFSDSFGLSTAHPQGFVRTNSNRYMYAGSHSQYEARKPGTIFIIEQTPDGKKYLAYLHRAKTRHPSGVHVLGRYLIFGERPHGSRDLLRVIDLDRANVRQDIAHLMPEPAADDPFAGDKLFGGGIGMARLIDGSYLLISSHPGSRDDRPRFHRFYRVTGDISNPDQLRIRFVRQQQYTHPPQFGSTERKYSENLSLITECGSGDIYAIHSSGDSEGPAALIGRGYWRLSKLVVSTAGIELQPIDVYEVPQNAQSCHMRSAASAGVNASSKLELLCHQYRKDPDPSLFNPLPILPGGNDSWTFVAETPN